MKKHSQVVSLRTREMIENEAADWLVKLDAGNLTAQDRDVLKQWLAQDPEHELVLKSYCAIWSDMDFLLNELPSAREYSTARKFSLLMPQKLLPASLAMVLLCSVAFFVWLAVKPETLETSLYVTGVGMQKVELLKDGSKTHLNTNSVVEVEYSDSVRIVRLLHGEAKFDVVHDPERPFIVYAGNQAVRAVGTEFVVRLTSDNILVTVTDGQVQLSKRSKEQRPVNAKQKQEEEQEIILLSKGEEADINVNDDTAPPRLKEISQEEMSRQLSWLNGQLIFENERLEKIITEINRYVPNRIIIEDPELRDIRISGRFRIGDSDALLEAIETSFDVKVKPTDDPVVQVIQKK